MRKIWLELRRMKTSGVSANAVEIHASIYPNRFSDLYNVRKVIRGCVLGENPRKILNILKKQQRGRSRNRKREQ